MVKVSLLWEDFVNPSLILMEPVIVADGVGGLGCVL